MKNLNNRSTSLSSLRGANAVCDVAIQRRCSCHPERSEGSRCSSVIPHSDAVSRSLSSRTSFSSERSVVRCSAFTLVELVIVIAIVIILSVVSVPIYRGYTKNAKLSEAYALLGTILSAQKAYYSQYGNFLHCARGSAGYAGYTANEEVLGIDARGNKYFTCFEIGNGYSGEVSDMKYRFYAYVKKPEEFIKSDGKANITLYYNVTIIGGARIDDKWS